MSRDYQLLVICGPTRSGTTYLGRLVDFAPHTWVINEPLNHMYGVYDIPVSRPYVDENHTEDFPEHTRLIDEIVQFKRSWGLNSQHRLSNPWEWWRAFRSRPQVRRWYHAAGS